jgi:hypothetical protein
MADIIKGTLVVKSPKNVIDSLSQTQLELIADLIARVCENRKIELQTEVTHILSSNCNVLVQLQVDLVPDNILRDMYDRSLSMMRVWKIFPKGYKLGIQFINLSTRIINTVIF